MVERTVAVGMAGATMASRDAVGDAFDVLTIRVWREPDTDRPFRARITYGGADRKTAASIPTTDLEDVVRAVRQWLEEHDPPRT
jgi:hypothetical protein